MEMAALVLFLGHLEEVDLVKGFCEVVELALRSVVVSGGGEVDGGTELGELFGMGFELWADHVGREVLEI